MKKVFQVVLQKREKRRGKGGVLDVNNDIGKQLPRSCSSMAAALQHSICE